MDYVRLSTFIETKLKCQYEDGKAFYEVTENEEATKDSKGDKTEKEEDFLYCKKILHPKKNEVLIIMLFLYLFYNNIMTIQIHDSYMQLDCEELELQSLIEHFYAIPGVPSMAVKPEQLRLEHHRIFIQSTSQGSRCLKKGEKILYLKEV